MPTGVTGVTQLTGPKPAAVPDAKIEISKDSPTRAELAAMGKTPLADVVRHAQTAFADTLAAGGRVLVTTSAGNGGKPVLTLIPPGFDPNQPAKVQTHYHGDLTSVADRNSDTTLAAKAMMAADPQRVIVLPEAGGNIGGSGTNWNNVVSQAQTTNDALAAAGISKVADRTVSGHSAGGRALARALAKPGGLQADHVLLLDCLYEPAAGQIREGLQKNGGAVKDITVVRGTNEMARADAMVAAFPGRAKKLTTGAVGTDSPHFAVARYFLDGKGLPQPGRGDGFDPPK